MLMNFQMDGEAAKDHSVQNGGPAVPEDFTRKGRSLPVCPVFFLSLSVSSGLSESLKVKSSER